MNSDVFIAFPSLSVVPGVTWVFPHVYINWLCKSFWLWERDKRKTKRMQRKLDKPNVIFIFLLLWRQLNRTHYSLTSLASIADNTIVIVLSLLSLFHTKHPLTYPSWPPPPSPSRLSGSSFAPPSSSVVIKTRSRIPQRRECAKPREWQEEGGGAEGPPSFSRLVEDTDLFWGRGAKRAVVRASLSPFPKLLSSSYCT